MVMIGIAGPAGSGKDTAAYEITEYYDYYHYSLAEPLKDMAAILWPQANWDDREWKERVDPFYGFSPRQFLQKLGTEFRNAIDPSKMLWCNTLERSVPGWLPLSRVVVPDIRFPHEQDWIHSHGGKVIQIVRAVPGVSEHISEKSIDPAKVDYVIDNGGTLEEFREKVRMTVQNINKGAPHP